MRLNRYRFSGPGLPGLLLCAMLLVPMSASANLSLLLFGPKDWPTTITVVREQFPHVKQITTSELAVQISAGAPPLIIDVRTKAEFEVSHLAGAINAESTRDVQAAIERAPGRPAVLYCSVGYRSSAVAEKLVQRGVKNVANLEGSIFAWANEGRLLVKDAQPATLVHPYNARWGKLLNRPLWSHEP